MLDEHAHDFGEHFHREIVEWIADHLSPEEVFGVDRLNEWAWNAGWEEPEENDDAS